MGPLKPCAACDGSGLVAPSAFAGESTSWPAWLAKAEAVEAAGGYPPSAGATRAGLIRPLACPECSGRESVRGITTPVLF